MDRLMASLSPYKIFKIGDEWVVKNNAGEVKAKFKTHAEARDYQKALYANVPDAARKAAHTKWTGKAAAPK